MLKDKEETMQKKQHFELSEKQNSIEKTLDFFDPIDSFRSLVICSLNNFTRTTSRTY